MLFLLASKDAILNYMTVDPGQIELTPTQKKRLAALAEQVGKPYSELVDEWLSAVPPDEVSDSKEVRRTAYEAFAAVGAVGCFDGPSDLSTNPRHMEGFGTNAKRSDPH